MSTLEDEIAKLGDIATASHALLQFALCLYPNNRGFTKKGTQWVLEPNFVTLSVHWQRANNLTICLRGNPSEFPENSVLPLSAAQHGYSRCKFDSIRQLGAATAYIERAFTLWDRGRDRIQKPVKVEEG